MPNSRNSNANVVVTLRADNLRKQFQTVTHRGTDAILVASGFSIC